MVWARNLCREYSVDCLSGLGISNIPTMQCIHTDVGRRLVMHALRCLSLSQKDGPPLSHWQSTRIGLGELNTKARGNVHRARHR